MNGLPTRRHGLFITGTDTDVGKTVVGAALVRHWRVAGHRVGAYKPVASGSVTIDTTSACAAPNCGDPPSGAPLDPVWEDVEAYFHALDGEFPRDRICPQRFTAPLAPPVAARTAGIQVNEALLAGGLEWWHSQADFMLVEGAGGLLAPISEQRSNADLAGALGFPLLIVARTGLGTINHTLLTVAVAEQRGLPIQGIVLNSPRPISVDQSFKSNPEELAARCAVPILGVLPYSPHGGLLHHPAFLRMLESLEQCGVLPRNS